MGVITYEMFAGTTPFAGDTLQAIMTGHLFREPPRLADIPPNLCVPPPIAEIVDRMLVKEPAHRYGSATDVLADLYDVNDNRWPTHAEILRRSQPARASAPLAPTIAAPGSQHKRMIAFGAAVAASAIGIASLAIWTSQPEPPAKQAVAPPLVAPDPG